MRLRELAASRVRFGYRRLTVLLRREGELDSQPQAGFTGHISRTGGPCGPTRKKIVRRAQRDPTSGGVWIL
jgi:hypothetical protein